LNGKKAIVPSIRDGKNIRDNNTIIIDEEDDPYAHGFQVLKRQVTACLSKVITNMNKQLNKKQ